MSLGTVSEDRAEAGREGGRAGGGGGNNNSDV